MVDILITALTSSAVVALPFCSHSISVLLPCQVTLNNFKRRYSEVLDAQRKWISAEKKLASSLLVFLEKALHKIPVSLCGKQMVELSGLPIA